MDVLMRIFSVIAAAIRAGAGMNNFPVLFSTDIGSDVDDALALLIMLNHPGIDLQGVYTVNGNVNVRCYIAKRMVDLAQKKIPVGRGVCKPLGALVPPYAHCEEYLVDDVYLDEKKMEEKGGMELIYQPLGHIGIITDGVRHMAEQLLRQPCVVFNTAPLTNIAMLLREYPEAAANISMLYVMGFRLNGDLEHNIRYDPVAAQEVMASAIPTIVIPGDLCNRWRMQPWNRYNMASPAGKYTFTQLKAFVGAKIVDDCRNSTHLLPSLEQSRMGPTSLLRTDAEKYFELEHFKRVFISNFDQYAAYLDRESFLDDFQKLIGLLENLECDFHLGSMLARELKQRLNWAVSVADAYIPYCFLYPEKLTVERRTISCNLDGETVFGDGEKHEAVTDLDFDHFERFLREHLR